MTAGAENRAGKRVLCVGHCRPDTRALAGMLQEHFGAEVVPADDVAQSLAQLRQEPFDLVLVNRILDRSGQEGLELIQQLKSDPELSKTPVMIVTNYAEHVQRACEAGAEGGFGKQALHAAATRALLEPWLR